MFKEEIELCNGVTAIFSDSDNVYLCSVPWHSRSIEVKFSTGKYSDEAQIEGLKATFERFWNNRETFNSDAQSDIKENLLPYIATHESSFELLPFPKVSEDDFDAEYWLDSVYILYSDGDAEVQMNYDKDGDELHSGELSVRISLDSDYRTYIAAFENIMDLD